MKIKRDLEKAEDELKQVHNQKTDEVMPAVRYFQIHFEYLQAQLAETKETMMALQSQMLRLESQLASMSCALAIQDAKHAGKHPNRQLSASSQIHLTASGSR